MRPCASCAVALLLLLLHSVLAKVRHHPPPLDPQTLTTLTIAEGYCKNRRKGKGRRCCLGERNCSISCRASYVTLWQF